MSEKIVVSDGVCYSLVDVADIIWFEARDRKISMLYNRNGCEARMEVSGTLGDLSRRLAKCYFSQVHRGYLISLNHLESVRNGVVKMKDSHMTEIPVGRVYMAGLIEMITRMTFTIL